MSWNVLRPLTEVLGAYVSVHACNCDCVCVSGLRVCAWERLVTSDFHHVFEGKVRPGKEEVVAKVIGLFVYTFGLS